MFIYARSRNGWILTFPLCHRGYVHTYAEADLTFVEDKDGLEHVVSKRTQKVGCWTHLLQSRFCSRSSAFAPRLRCVNVCNDLCWSQFSVHLHSVHVYHGCRSHFLLCACHSRQSTVPHLQIWTCIQPRFQFKPIFIYICQPLPYIGVDTTWAPYH